VAAKKMVPPNKSCLKRLRQAEKANAANRSTRSAIRTSLGIVRKAATKEEALKEVPRLFSMMDKAAPKAAPVLAKTAPQTTRPRSGICLTNSPPPAKPR